MGRRSAKEQGPFYVSVAGWLLPWLLIAAIVGAAVWVAVGKLGDDKVDVPSAQPARDASPSPTPSETESPEPAPTPTASPEPAPTPTASPEREPKKDKDEPEPPKELITEGVTVQVLNATGGVPGKAEEMAGRLGGLGYEISAIGTAVIGKNRTVVYWSTPEWKDAATAMADRFGWRVAPKPFDLSSTVSLHVMVGADEV